MGFTDQLASMYTDLASPPGIPWAGLVSQGHGISDNGYDPAYMDVMLAEGAKFFGVIGQMSQEFRTKYSTIEASQARASMTQLMALIDQTGADVWQATKKGDWSAAVNFPRSVSVDALATLAASAANGAYLHYDGVMEAAMRAGKITPDEVMAHANSVVQTFQTFQDLNTNKHLDDFKQEPPIAGMGNPVLLAGWALAALGIVLVLGICYLVYVFKIASPIEQKVIEYCDKVSKTGTPADTQACVQALTSMQKDGNAGLLGFMGTILQPVVIVAAIGVAIWIGSMLLPGLLARKAAR